MGMTNCGEQARRLECAFDTAIVWKSNAASRYVRVATCCDVDRSRSAGKGIAGVTSGNERKLRLTCRESPRKTARRGAAGRFAFCKRHFDAVLVSMLTTWTRRLIGSIGAFGSFGLVLP